MRGLFLVFSIVYGLDLPNFIGTQHFQPCYYINASVPCLLDGAIEINHNLKSNIFKFSLSKDMNSVYPFNNNDEYKWPDPSKFTSLVDIASTPQIKDLFASKGKFSFSFTTFVLWAYSVSFGANFCYGFTEEDAQHETKEFSDLTSYLMTTYANQGVSFYLEHWEGDWAVRCGNYNASQPPNPVVLGNFQRWLQARQTGVNKGRQAYCLESMNNVNCESGTEIMNAAKVWVYNGCEVNLVLASITTPFPNLIRSVIPHVQLDYVSYSSYDTMESPTLSTALDFIHSQLNLTASAPSQPVFITEWGLPLNQVNQSRALAVANNVIGIAASKPYVGRVLFWQIINNELLAGGLCSSQPVFDPTKQRGFWAVLPNGDLSFFGDYLQGLINGSRPVPPP